MLNLIDYLQNDFERDINRDRLYAWLYENKISAVDFFNELMVMNKFDRENVDSDLLESDIWE